MGPPSLGGSVPRFPRWGELPTNSPCRSRGYSWTCFLLASTASLRRSAIGAFIPFGLFVFSVCLSRLWCGDSQSCDCGGNADGAGQEFNCVVHRSCSRTSSPSLLLMVPRFPQMGELPTKNPCFSRGRRLFCRGMDHDNPVPCFPIRWSCMALSPGASGSPAMIYQASGRPISERP